MAVEIECVTEVSDELAEAFARLMPQLSPRLGALSREAMERVVCSDGAALFAARLDGRIAGVLTLAMCSVGLLCKRFTQAIDAMDFRPIRALSAMGVSSLPRLARGMLPQLYAPFLSAALYRFDVNVREASVLGLVGAGGIGAPLIFAMNHYDWSTVSTLAIGLVLLALGIDLLSGLIRKRLSL